MPPPDEVVCAGTNLRPFAFVGAVGDDLADGYSLLSSPALFQLLYNVVMFVPAGVLLRRSFKWPVGRLLVVALAAAVAIEAIQGSGVLGLYDCAYRVLDIDDVLANVTGALVGALLAPWFVLVPRPGHAVVGTGRSGPLRRATAAAIDFTVAGVAGGEHGIGLAFALLVVFVAVPVLTGGATPGQVVVRAAVVRMDGAAAEPWILALRGVLIAGPWLLTVLALRWTSDRAEWLPGLVVIAPLVVLAGLVLMVIGTVALRRDGLAPQDLLTGTQLRVVEKNRDHVTEPHDGTA